MTTDRELTEAAAKAAGIVYIHGCFDAALGLCVSVGADEDQEWWHPLDDDGDALRLAVKLKLCFGPNFDGDLAVCFGSNGRNITEPFGDDPYAATRRAIVRAAAEIWRTK